MFHSSEFLLDPPPSVAEHLDPLPVLAGAAAAAKLRRIPVRSQRELVELAAGERAQLLEMRTQVRVKLARKIELEEGIEAGIRGKEIQAAAVGQRRGHGDRLRSHQSTRAPEALTMRPHFSWSARITRENSSGEPVHSSKACALRRWRMSGERRASTSF